MNDESSRKRKYNDQNAKQDQLDQFRIQNTGKPLTTNEGKKYQMIKIN